MKYLNIIKEEIFKDIFKCVKRIFKYVSPQILNLISNVLS